MAHLEVVSFTKLNPNLQLYMPIEKQQKLQLLQLWVVADDGIKYTYVLRNKVLVDHNGIHYYCGHKIKEAWIFILQLFLTSKAILRPILAIHQTPVALNLFQWDCYVGTALRKYEIDRVDPGLTFATMQYTVVWQCTALGNGIQVPVSSLECTGNLWIIELGIIELRDNLLMVSLIQYLCFYQPVFMYIIKLCLKKVKQKLEIMQNLFYLAEVEKVNGAGLHN